MSDSPDHQARDRAELREKAFLGVRWVAIARLCAEIVSFGSMVLLARLVPPAEFGRAAVALIIPGLATVLATQGFGTPLVQRKELGRTHFEVAALLSIVFTLALSLAVFFAAPAISGALFEGDGGTLLQIAAPSFLFAGIGAVASAELQRQLDLKRASRIEMLSFVLGTAISVAMALGGADATAIVVGAVATRAIAALLLLLAVPFVMPRWHRKEAREITAFGLPAAGASLLNFGTRNIDYAIIAARMGAAQVGFYYRAYNLGVEYQSKITRIMSQVAFPVYSRASGLADMRRMRARITRIHSIVLFPALGLLIVTAPVLIPWLLGQQWEPAVVPTQILAIAGLIAAVLAGNGPILLASGRPGVLLGWNIFSFTLYSATVYVTAGYGLTAVSLGVVGVFALGLILGNYVLLQRLVGIPLRETLVDVVPALVSGIALAAVAFPLQEALLKADLPTVIVLVLVGLAGSAVYALTLRRAFPEAWEDVRLLFEKVVGGRRLRRRAAPLAPGPEAA